MSVLYRLCLRRGDSVAGGVFVSGATGAFVLLLGAYIGGEYEVIGYHARW